MAAAAAYRVEVTILGVVDLLAEAGVGVLTAGAAIATSPSGHLGVRGRRDGSCTALRLFCLRRKELSFGLWDEAGGIPGLLASGLTALLLSVFPGYQRPAALPVVDQRLGLPP